MSDSIFKEFFAELLGSLPKVRIVPCAPDDDELHAPSNPATGLPLVGLNHAVGSSGTPKGSLPQNK